MVDLKSKPEKAKENNKKVEVDETKGNWQIKAAIGVGGAIAVLIAGLVLQEIYSRFVIIPTKERTFVDVTSLDYDHGIRMFASPDGLIEFRRLSDRSLITKIQVQNSNGSIIPFGDLDYVQFQEGDIYHVGKLEYKYDNFPVTIKYLINSEHLTIVTETGSLGGQNPSVIHNLVFSHQDGSQSSTKLAAGLNFITHLDGTLGAVNQTSTSLKEQETSEDYFEVTKIIKTALEKDQETFEKIYKLTENQLPKFYQEMGRSALASVVSSIVYHNNTPLIGHENGVFKSEHELVTYLLESHNALDSQIFGLIVASRYDVKGVELALESWLNTINELQELANYVKDASYHVDKIQQPLLFQLIKVLVNNPDYKNLLIKLFNKLEFIAEETYKHSTHFYWIGTSSDIFGLKSKTGTKAQSLELNCLLEDMMQTMVQVAKLAEKPVDLYVKQVEHLRKERAQFWDAEKSEFKDVHQKKLVKSTSPYAPLILGVLSEDSIELTALISSLETSEFFTKMGIQENSATGSSIAANYLLLGSLKKYSDKSGPNQHRAHILFSVLKNNLISHVARNFKSTKLFFSHYNEEGNPMTGEASINGALILPIMAELFV